MVVGSSPSRPTNFFKEFLVMLEEIGETGQSFYSELLSIEFTKE